MQASSRSLDGLAPPYLAATIVLLTSAVLVADLITPLGYTEWMCYVGPVALAAAGNRVAMPLATAVMAIGLLVVGAFLTRDQVVIQHVAYTNRAIGAGVITVMGVIGSAFVRTRVQVARESWLRTGENRIRAALEGNPSTDQVATRSAGVICGHLGAELGVLYRVDGPRFRRVASYGANEDTPDEIPVGTTLLGRCAASRRIEVVTSVPEDYLAVRSGLGRASPRALVLVPLESDDAVNGVLELAFFRPLDPIDIDQLDRVRFLLGLALQSATFRERVQVLLQETQSQAEELQAQQEELRVTNEQLETQAAALSDSQRRLELQHVDLERTNAELEEQAVGLEERQLELLRARDQVERANQHKTEFLANMSHELRTPLNSSMILARMLAENRAGNLTDEQVRFAETIHAAGNDLLTLINDILDLSKIEAGKLEPVSEAVEIGGVVRELERICRPIANSRGLGFRIDVLPSAPAELRTDRQRVQQILRNLLSNAMKFTERGEVGLEIAGDPRGVVFRVRDTGVGISESNHKLIFEPFRQVESGVSRPHGGSGLGLSISRDLARLLGGEIELESAVGRGSTFRLVLPVEAPSTPIAPASDPPRLPPPIQAAQTVFVPDDRDRVVPGARSLLVIEDDERFARLLVDLARELEIPCLAASNAQDGIALARRYRPTGIVLDVQLPDDSGLTVLERLKRDPATRHIPIHMTSAFDLTGPARHLGAVGYVIKPAAREELVGAVRRLQHAAAQRSKAVLVVEDDPVQRDSVCRLIQTEGVATEAVGSVAGALQLLRERTFDCMIVDLHLSDGSGFDLLDELARGDAYSFPPVIVYTGQSLSGEQERRLLQYSRSVIVKGARSPERLLDEVTLFLHQVEQELPPEHQRMLRVARSRDAALEDRRILVVEDDVRNVFALTSLLEPRGAIVDIARNGQEALDRLARDPAIDLVLMDVMMPVMDGLEATRRIRQDPSKKKLPIIALTAKAMPDDKERCLAAGANDYASKPLDVDKLVSLIRVWMPHGRR